MNPTTTLAARRRRRRLVVVGVAAAGLSVAGAGASVAVAPTSPVAHVVAGALHQVGVDWSQMPEGYTRAQYEAFWGAGYTPQDVAALGALWSTDDTETKSRAGQLLLDGQPLPVAPSGETALPGSDPGDGDLGDGDLDVPDEDGPAGPADGTDERTEAELAAFWDAGYTVDDMAALSGIWHMEAIETKARAGQMLLDGQTPPVAPGSTPAGGRS
ncbi:hypothetical protein [Cellulomonas sp. URHB0016]